MDADQVAPDNAEAKLHQCLTRGMMYWISISRADLAKVRCMGRRGELAIVGPLFHLQVSCADLVVRLNIEMLNPVYVDSFS